MNPKALPTLFALLLILTEVGSLRAGQNPSPPKLTAEQQAGMKKLQQEPGVLDVQKACLSFFRISPDEVASMRDRASWKSALPNIKAKYRRNDQDFDRDFWDYTVYQDRVMQRDLAGFATNEYEVSAEWDLARLVFNPELLDVSSLVVLQEAELKEITRIYYIRRRLQIDLVLVPDVDETTRLSKQLRIDELTATIDAMTGGYFTKSIQEKEKAQTNAKKKD